MAEAMILPETRTRSAGANPSPITRIVSVLALAGSAASIGLICTGRFGTAELVATVTALVTIFVSTPPPAPEPDTLVDLSHEDWAAAEPVDKAGVAAFLLVMLAILSLGWYLDFDARFDWAAGLWTAGMWTLTATVQSAVLAYRVWWKRQMRE
ncbi:MAG: hypothetical protein JWN66_2476 [Sphingomonas bacterium]|jgi:hypothetical protein|uniref:hypothetical protein n=1 Tax=Sphingomonas bacterium TaxID=1895847 RepID=UPI00263525B6|nr:hypothetical protein [Sphingomonas bacterium]MDB5705360.1 hypothetical protein [Sphingomonas bacterium]